MFTQETLEAKSGPELVAIFNGIPGVSPVKRFRNRETGVKRILTTYSDLEKSVKVVTDPKDVQIAMVQAEKVLDVVEVLDAIGKIAEAVVPSVERQPKVRGIYSLDRKELIRTFRPNSRRGRLITLLLGKGATFDELLANKEVGFQQEDVLHKTLRILNWWTGYGLATDSNGIIRLTS